MMIEQNTNYAYKLKYMDNPTFDKVRDLSTKFYRELNALVLVEIKTGNFKICGNAFLRRPLRSMVIPDSVTSIGDSADTADRTIVWRWK